MLCQMWPQCLHINWEHVRAAADASHAWGSDLGRPEMKSEVSVWGCIALAGDSSFDPLPCLAQEHHASLFRSRAISR